MKRIKRKKTVKKIEPCSVCEGKGVLCSECHQPTDACECIAEEKEPCMHCQGTGNSC